MDIYSSIKPYTYIIRFLPTGQVYYGMRSANKVPPLQDLWIKYFTSSKKVKKLIAEHGKNAFAIQIRKVFDTTEQAADWEKKVLTKMKILQKPQLWLNESISGTKFRFSHHTPESKAAISKIHKGKVTSEETKKKISESRKGKASYIPTAEQKLASSLRQKGMPKLKGWQHTEESKSKIGAAHKGKKVSPETRKKLSVAAKNRKKSVAAP